MTVQRQYTLPNCNLKLEGLTAGDEGDPMAPLTVVLNSECTFLGLPDTLSGGRDFLNGLVQTVSDYVQSLLSGVPYPLVAEVSDEHPVALKLGSDRRHHLTAQVVDDQGAPTQKSLELSSVQLFDLMEAIDQLLADTLTLPDMTLQLSSLHRRHARPAEPAAQRALPAAAGLSALAAAAAVLFMVPVPEFEPARPEEEQAEAALVEEGNGAAPAAPDGPPPEPTAATAGEETVADPVAAATALGRLGAAPSITDADTLATLQEDLEATLTAALPEALPFEEDLVYRVAVSAAGDILGYKYENEAALINIDSTPLPELTFIPLDAEAAIAEPVAQYEITFTPEGEVEAEPIAPAESDATTEE